MIYGDTDRYPSLLRKVVEWGTSDSRSQLEAAPALSNAPRVRPQRRARLLLFAVARSCLSLPAGPVTVTLDFTYDGGGVGKGGKAVLLVNGKPVAEGARREDATEYLLG